MISHLLKAIKLDHLNNFGLVETATIESACAELDAEDLKRILKVYTGSEEMFTAKYLHGRNENIKLLVDMGKSVDQSRDEADVMYAMLTTRETLYFRCLVEVYREWYKKTKPPPVVVKVDEFGQPVSEVAVESKPEEPLTEVKVLD
jgi:hypothetical protein